MRIIFILILFTFINPSISFPQSLIEYESRLTNNDYQIWVLDSTDERLSTDNCLNGISYKFLINEKFGIKTECQNARWITTYFKWDLLKYSEIEYLLILKYNNSNYDEYEIDFYLRDGETILRLREPLNSNIKTKTKEYYFHKN